MFANGIARIGLKRGFEFKEIFDNADLVNCGGDEDDMRLAK